VPFVEGAYIVCVQLEINSVIQHTIIKLRGVDFFISNKCSYNFIYFPILRLKPAETEYGSIKYNVVLLA
jgi:hypothetical protein